MNIVESILKIGLFLFIYYAILIRSMEWAEKNYKSKTLDKIVSAIV